MRLVSQPACRAGETGSILVRSADGSVSHGDRPSLQNSERAFDSFLARHGRARREPYPAIFTAGLCRRLPDWFAPRPPRSVTEQVHEMPLQHEGRARRWYRRGSSSILDEGSTRGSNAFDHGGRPVFQTSRRRFDSFRTRRRLVRFGVWGSMGPRNRGWAPREFTSRGRGLAPDEQGLVVALRSSNSAKPNVPEVTREAIVTSGTRH